MKKLVSAAIACAVLGTPLSAQNLEPHGTIVVQPDQGRFVTNLGRELDRQLYRIPYPLGYRQSGVVKVRFLANGDGRAEQVSLFENSGSHSMDGAALRAVRSLDNLGSTEWSDEGGQDVLLSIVFATSNRDARRLAERVANENAALIASGALDPQVLAVTMVPAARS